MQHTQSVSKQAMTKQSTQQNLQTRGRLAFAIVCALWLALGGVIPAQAAAPTVGALVQAQTVLPTRLIIPSLEIDASIESVGQDDTDTMAAPSTIDKVAWYNPGPVPGDNGNAVMAGHYDDVKGKPAVFWSLEDLAPGAEIIVQFSDETEKRFEVMTVETYASDEAPLERIFGVDFERDLNLITCDGQWNAQSKLYSQRLVVYARLIRDGGSISSSAPTTSTVATTALAEAAATVEEAAVADVEATVTQTETVATATVEAVNVETVTTVASESNVESVDDATQTNTTSTLPVPPSPRTTHARQNRGQPITTH